MTLIHNLQIWEAACECTVLRTALYCMHQTPCIWDAQLQQVIADVCYDLFKLEIHFLGILTLSLNIVLIGTKLIVGTAFANHFII